jgi:hypothetical protein
MGVHHSAELPVMGASDCRSTFRAQQQQQQLSLTHRFISSRESKGSMQTSKRSFDVCIAAFRLNELIII